MRIEQGQIEQPTHGQGLYEFTQDVREFVRQAHIDQGSLTLFCMHTSCALLIQENADPDVQTDLQGFFSRIVPENMNWLTHTLEGPDDMPAHIKTALMQTSIVIPVNKGMPVLGTWQGVYLFEHRRAPHHRRIFLNLLGDGNV